MTTIFEVPALVKKVASLDLSAPVKPIGQDTYKSDTHERRVIHARLIELFEAGTTGTAEFRTLAARLTYLNG